LSSFFPWLISPRSIMNGAVWLPFRVMYVLLRVVVCSSVFLPGQEYSPLCLISPIPLLRSQGLKRLSFSRGCLLLIRSYGVLWRIPIETSQRFYRWVESSPLFIIHH